MGRVRNGPGTECAAELLIHEKLTQRHKSKAVKRTA